MALVLLRPLRLVTLIAVMQQAVGNAIRGRVVMYTVAGADLRGAIAQMREERQRSGGQPPPA